MLDQILKWRSDFDLPMLSEEEAWKMLVEEEKELQEAIDKAYKDTEDKVEYVYEMFKEYIDLIFVSVQYDLTIGSLDAKEYKWILEPTRKEKKCYHKHLVNEALSDPHPEFKVMFNRVLKSNYSKRTPVLVPPSETFKYFRVQEKEGWFYYYNEDNKLIKPPTYQRWDQIPMDEASSL